MMRYLSSSALLFLGLTGFTLAGDHTKDSLQTVKQGVAAQKAVLVDVRENDEWKDGHIKGARHLPLSQLNKGLSKEQLKQVLPEGKVIYLYCASGGRCLKAADLLKKQGLDVRALKPGYEALLRAGFENAP